MSYAHESGHTDGTATVPTSKRLVWAGCAAGGSGATIVITPAGQSALDPIYVAALGTWNDEWEQDPSPRTGSFSAGTTLAFAGVTAWEARYA